MPLKSTPPATKPAPVIAPLRRKSRRSTPAASAVSWIAPSVSNAAMLMCWDTGDDLQRSVGTVEAAYAVSAAHGSGRGAHAPVVANHGFAIGAVAGTLAPVAWTMLYLFIFLKLPIAGLGWIVWWAVHSEPETEPV